MTFEYLQRVLVDAQLDVEDVGCCAILARNDLGEEFYLLTRSEMGWVEVIEYGPCTPDLDILPFNIQLLYDRFEFSQYKLEKRIDKFLNNPKRAITQAETTTFEKLKPLIRNPVDVVLKDIVPDNFDENEEEYTDDN